MCKTFLKVFPQIVKIILKSFPFLQFVKSFKISMNCKKSSFNFTNCENYFKKVFNLLQFVKKF